MCMLTLMAGCSEEIMDTALAPTVSEGTEFTLSFGVTLPEENSTRAFGETSAFLPDTASIVLLAFDENHKLTNVYHGEHTKTEGNCNYYKVTLKTTEKKRIFHVVVNHNALSEVNNLYGFESDIFNSSTMVVNKGTDVYWTRFEVDKVQNTKNADIKTAMQHLKLVRNFCKIKLSLAAAVAAQLHDVEWGLVNVPTRGTVAPYINEQLFADYNVTLPENTTLYENLEKEQGFYGHVPRTDAAFYGSATINSDDDVEWVSVDEPLYCFENEGEARSEDWRETSILMRGKKGASTAYSYYRIAFVDQSNGNEPYYLLRNIEYLVAISELNATGYSSAAEAWNRPAGNNISGDTQTSSYPIITINKSALRVEFIKKYIVSPATFTMFYRYVPDVTTGDGDTYTASNDKVVFSCDKKTLTAGTEYSNYAFKSFSVAKNDYNTNYRLVTFTPSAITGESAVTTTMRVGVENESDVYRDVTFVLRQRYLLKSMSITKGDDDNSFVLGLKVPANLPEELFPLEFTLETNPLCIYADANSGTVMSTESTQESILGSDETFQFIRRVSLADYEALKKEDGYRTIPFYFKFNGVSLIAGANAVWFGVYNEYFSCDPEGDRSSTTATPLKQSFVVTKNGTDSYSVY